jgi:hypothetical protein
MTIEELPVSGDPGRATESDWLTTMGALGAGIVIGVVLMLAIGPQALPAPSPSPTGSAIGQVSPSPSSAILRPPTPAGNLLDNGLPPDARQSVSVDGVSFSFSAPAAGWGRYGDLYISKDTHGSQGAEAMIFWARHPNGRYAQACNFAPSAPIGYTAAEVAEGLATGVPGTELVAGPSDVTVGGLAAKQVVLFVRADTGCDPGFFYTWDGEDARGGALWGRSMLGDTISIWVFDVAGERFIIAAETHLNAGAELEAEVLQIVDSIEFEVPDTRPGLGDYTSGRHSTTVDSTTLSFAIATSGWEPYPWEGAPLGSTLISKSIRGPQGAEEVIFWAPYPSGATATACGVLQEPELLTTALGVATRVATAPGTDLVTGPEEVTVGGHPAAHVVVDVSEAIGCDPGFFYTWEPQQGGAMWTRTPVGATIRVWVVEVDAGLLFIAAVTVQEAAGREQEIQRIIDSIEFE